MIPQNTSHTLLRRMSNPDDSDWDTFYRTYREGILAYARSCGCSHAQAEDILQETMVLLIEKLRHFKYDPEKGSFRGYLRTIVRRKIYRYFDRQKRRGEQRLDTTWQKNLVDPNTLNDEEGDHKHWRKFLLVTAMRQVEQEYVDKGWSGFGVFRDYVVAGRSAAEVADAHDMDKNNVYQIRNRILNRIKTLTNHMDAKGIGDAEVPPFGDNEIGGAAHG